MPDDDKKIPREFIIVGIAALLGAGGGQGIGFLVPSPERAEIIEIRDAVRSLQQYHASEWPLERQLLSIKTTQLETRIDVLEAAVDKLEDDIQDMQ